MGGDVIDIKVCSPLKLRCDLIGDYHAICHYSYNLLLGCILKRRNIDERFRKMLLICS